MQHVSDRVMVMYLGRLVETGPVCVAASSLYVQPACRRAATRSEATPRRVRDHQGRSAELARAAIRLRLSSALPARDRALPARAPGAAAACRRDDGRLSQRGVTSETTSVTDDMPYHAEASWFALTMRLGCELFRGVPEAGAARSASADRAAHKELERNGGRCRD